MKTLKGLVSHRHSNGLPTKSCFIFLMTIVVFTIGFSCQDNDIEPQTPGIEHSNLRASTGVGGVSDENTSNTNLKTLYLENFSDPSKNQLAKLLSNENYKKLIFQSYLTRNGQLTLVAFAAKQNGKDFNPDYQVLGVIDDNPGQDLQDKNVFLGDQKLESSSGFQLLKDAVNTRSKNDTLKNYVIFSPELKLIPGSRSYVVEYSINFINSLDGFAAQILPRSSTRLNPSPPY